MAFLVFACAFAARAEDCRVAAEAVRTEIEAAPGEVLTIVEDALVAHPGCVCEVVKAAVSLTKADPVTVQKIVFVAVKAMPENAPAIAECAVSAAPDQADAVRAAFAQAFEDQKGKGLFASKDKQPQFVESTPKTKPASANSSPAVVSHDADGKSVVTDGGKGVVIEDMQPTFADGSGTDREAASIRTVPTPWLA